MPLWSMDDWRYVRREVIKDPAGREWSIALMDVLEHLPDPAGTMRRCLDLLKPDGVLIIQTPCYPPDAVYEDMVERNDPFLQQRPIVVSLLTMTRPEANLLRKAYPRTRLIGQEQLKALGLETQLFQ